MNLGTLFDGLGCFPFEHGAYPPHSDCKDTADGIRSLIAISTANAAIIHSVLYLHQLKPYASPRAISGRTSYPPTRLEFLPYPQVIRGRFNERRFGPPVSFTSPSTCSWIDRRASGLCLRTKSPYSGSLSLRLRLYDLTSHANITRRFILQ